MLCKASDLYLLKDHKVGAGEEMEIMHLHFADDAQIIYNTFEVLLCSMPSDSAKGFPASRLTFREMAIVVGVGVDVILMSNLANSLGCKVAAVSICILDSLE